MSKFIHCESCGNTGWWCRGCGYQLKMTALQGSGLTESEAQGICDAQQGPCDEFGPCYICNRDGKRCLKT